MSLPFSGSETTFIYDLLCPLENKIKHISKSDNPRKRFKQHLKSYCDTPKALGIEASDLLED